MPAEGITPLTAEQRRNLMEIVDYRHDRTSTIVTSQVPVTLWHGYIGNPTIADAVLSHLMHGTNRIELKRESLRQLRVAKARLDEAATKQPNLTRSRYPLLSGPPAD